MDVDEEIIFNHSPFHQYLIDCETMYGRNENLNKNAIENAIARKELVNKKGSSIGLLEEQTMEPDRFRVVTKGWIENSLFQRLFRRFGFENLYGLDLYYGYRMTDICLKSKLPDEDDAKLLEAYKDSFDQESSQIFRHYPHPIRLVAVTVAAISYLIGRILCCHPIGVSETVAHRSWNLVITDVLCGIVTIVHLLHFYEFSSRQSKHRRNTECFRKFLSLASDLFNECRRTIQCLRDREVLQRGYTMVSKQTAVFNGPTMSNIPDKIVRKRFLICVRQLFLVTRNETICLASTFPNQFNDLLASCMYHVQLENFGSLFVTEFDEFEIDAIMENEMLSLSSLKAAFELLQLQMSEFLRLLCLKLWPCFYHKLESKNYDSTISEIPEILMQLCEPFAFNYKQLQRSLVPVNIQLPDVGRSMSTLAGNSEITGFIAPVHSLNVHLQLAFEKSNILEQNVDKQSTFDKEITLTRLQELSSQLTTAQTCIDEAMSLLTKNKSSECVQNSMPTSSTMAEEAQLPLTKSDEGQIDIDQVFEAVAGETVSDESKSECVLEEFDLMKRKRETRNLLNEMQHILEARSAQMKERERKALAHQLNIPLESVELPDWHQPQLNEYCGKNSAINDEVENSRTTSESDRRTSDADSSWTCTPALDSSLAAMIAAKSQQMGRKVDLFKYGDESESE